MLKSWIKMRTNQSTNHSVIRIVNRGSVTCIGAVIKCSWIWTAKSQGKRFRITIALETKLNPDLIWREQWRWTRRIWRKTSHRVDHSWTPLTTIEKTSRSSPASATPIPPKSATSMIDWRWISKRIRAGRTTICGRCTLWRAKRSEPRERSSHRYFRANRANSSEYISNLSWRRSATWSKYMTSWSNQWRLALRTTETVLCTLTKSRSSHPTKRRQIV